jgi:hypothetical protein
VKPYNKDAVCPKCGGGDIRSDFHADNWRDCFVGCPGNKPYLPAKQLPAISGEHIVRTCGYCHYEWLEAPLDAANPFPEFEPPPDSEEATQ